MLKSITDTILKFIMIFLYTLSVLGVITLPLFISILLNILIALEILNFIMNVLNKIIKFYRGQIK